MKAKLALSKLQEKKHLTCWANGEEMKWATRHWATKIGVKLRQIHLRQMNTKWASISTAGRITLNTELLAMPKTLGEYVIVHELVHLLAPNHGKVFKCFMYAYLPNWEELDFQLKTYRE
jgi:predicted metal-dependent hydrolase